MKTQERLIFALDYPDTHTAKAAVLALGDSVHFYKLGLELFTAGGYRELLDWLHARGKKTFVDLKFFDVPETVRRAVAQVARYGSFFTTVHGNDDILAAAASAKGEQLKVLAVTVLTSFDNADVRALGAPLDVKELVLARARRARALGCDGVVASGQEAASIRQSVGETCTIVTPGVRLQQAGAPVDDQKRTVDIQQAFAAGADYVVVGRPIRDHHGFASSYDAACAIQMQIADACAGRA